VQAQQALRIEPALPITTREWGECLRQGDREAGRCQPGGPICGHRRTSGRSLGVMEFNRGAVTAWAAGVCGGAATLAAVFAMFRGRVWHIAVLVLAVIAGLTLVLLLVIGYQSASGWLRERGRQRQQRKGESSPLIIDRWLYSHAAFDIGTLADLGHRAFSHPLYMRPSGNKPPAMRVGAYIACSPLADDDPTAEHLRSAMRECLRQPDVMRMIGKLTDVGTDSSWHSQPGLGRFNLEADLLSSFAEGRVLASALLLLPEQDIRGGKSRTVAELYLHVDLPTKGGVPVKVDIAGWHDRFTSSLAIPGALARFLKRVGLATSGNPAVRFGVQLQAGVTAAIGLDEIVDFGDLAFLSPRKYSMQFDGWAVADPRGKAADAISRRFITELCECTGRTGYEGILAELPGEPQSERVPAGLDRGRFRITRRVVALGAVAGFTAAVIAWITIPGSPPTSVAGRTAPRHSTHPVMTTSTQASDPDIQGSPVSPGCPRPSKAEPDHAPVVAIKVVHWCAAYALRLEDEFKLRLSVKNISSASIDIDVAHWWLLVRTPHLGRWTPPALGPSMSLRPKVVKYKSDYYWAIPANMPHSYDVINSELETFTSYWSESVLDPGITYPSVTQSQEVSRSGDLVFYVPVSSPSSETPSIVGVAYLNGNTVEGIAYKKAWGTRINPNEF
jgi:hypothetical protein